MKFTNKLITPVLLIAVLFSCQPAPPPLEEAAAPAVDPLEQLASSDPLIAGFQKSTVASVSDAVDQVVGKPGFMHYDMRPIVGKAFVGRAVTALVKPAPKPTDSTPSTAIPHSIQMIEGAQPGDVGVIVYEGTVGISALGGLMGTTAKARGMAGMVLDGALRDVGEVRALALPVFARAISPANTVGRYMSVAANIPVQCAGVAVSPGDIIVAGEDGVVVVPKDQAEAVLKVAQEIDERESKMVPFIQREKSLTKAVAEFNRI